MSRLNLYFTAKYGKPKICFYNKVNHKITKFLLSLLLISILFLPTLQSKVQALAEPEMRVLILKDNFLRIRSDKTIPLIVKGDMFANKRVKGITVKKNDTKTILFFDKDKTKLYELDNTEGFEVRSSDKKGIWVGGKRFSGKINVTSLENGIYAVNVLGVEEYLSSVVGSEMPYKWPMEALKAQAIASRTYALKKKNNDLFDIDSTKNDQVYNGLESETDNTRKAVRRTRSMVILHNKKLINALFHSSSGGMTENSEDVWDNELPYLVSVKDFDTNNPKRNWKKIFLETDLEELFPKIGGIKQIQILELSGSGRIKKVEIFGNYGSMLMKGTELRKKLDLKSTLFRFKFVKSNNKTVLLIKGMGSGHGVGMSQWGARFMAKAGYKANEILEYFYTGVEIKPFDESYI